MATQVQDDDASQQIDLIEPNACTVITVNGCVPHAANNAKNKQQRQRRRHASKNHSKINSKSSATHNKACSKAHQNQNTNQIDESTNQSTTKKSSQNTLAKSKHVQLKSSNQPTSNSKPHPAPFTRTTNKQLATGKTETPRTHQFTNSACTTRVRGPTKPPRGMMTQTKLNESFRTNCAQNTGFLNGCVLSNAPPCTGIAPSLAKKPPLTWGGIQLW